MLEKPPSPPRRMKEDVLTSSLEPLRHALAAPTSGHEREWAQDVALALARVEQGLRQHATSAQAADGLFTEVDKIRPTLVRQKNELQRGYKDHLEQCLALQREVRQAGDAFAPSANTFAKTETAAQPTDSGGIPDFGALRARVEQWLTNLQQTQEAETDLIQESVNTDIGVGD